MRKWLALVGCVALLGGSPAVADPDPPARYTLTMTYMAQADARDTYEHCNWGAPIPPASDLVWVCNTGDSEHHEFRSYGASSVRPFAFARQGDYYSFVARMKGTYQQVGGFSSWSNWWLGGLGYNLVTASGGHDADGAVTGTVTLKGINPARLINDIGPTKEQSGTQTVVTCSTGDCTTSTTDFPGGFIDDSWLKRVNLRKVFGREFTVVDRRTTPPLTTNGTTTREQWRFHFTPVADPVKTERWQVEVRGQDRWSWGMYTGLRAGVDIDWAHRTTLVVKNGKLTSAQGKVHVVRVRPFSEPPGAFDVTTYTATTPPAYELKKAAKSGNRVTLGLWKDNRSEYTVDFSVAAAGPALLAKLRSIGVADPEATYQAVLARGAIQDSATPIVPSSSRLAVTLRPGTFNRDTDEFNTQLPCRDSGATQQDCFFTRGGQRVTVTQLK